MEILKELSAISLPITEPEYRQMPELSYSNLSTYETLGYNGLDHLFDKKESLSLTLGSAVDAIITGGKDEFNSLFAVVDIPSMGEKESKIVNYLFDNWSKQYPAIEEVPATYILDAANQFGYGADNWKPETKVRKITEAGSRFWISKVAIGDKTLLTLQNYENVNNMVRALRESPATCGYFADNDEMSPIRRYYQLKFKAIFDNVGYRNMADLIIVDYEKKKVYPIDLKTSLSCSEWDFQENFKKWHYYIQARLYWRIIRANMDADDYFKDFTLEDYRFIIVNPKTLTPLVWEFPLTKSIGTLVTDTGYEVKDPFEIGKELRAYLDCKPPVPNGINKDGVNMINCLTIKQ
jgi:hypothetical protein